MISGKGQHLQAGLGLKNVSTDRAACDLNDHCIHTGQTKAGHECVQTCFKTVAGKCTQMEWSFEVKDTLLKWNILCLQRLNSSRSNY